MLCFPRLACADERKFEVSSEAKMAKFCMIAVFLFVAFDVASSAEYEDRVKEIYTGNFSSLVESSDKLWVIKYYIPWCGFCIRFAPVFSALAETAKEWDFLEFGAISCPMSSALCSAHGSTKVPDVKILVPGKDGMEIKKIMPVNDANIAEKLTSNLLDELDVLHRTTPLGSKKIPLLSEIKDFTDIQQNNGEEVDLIFLIVEQEGDATRNAELVILDTFQHRNIFRVFRTSLRNARGNMNVFQPGLFLFSNNGTFLKIQAEFTRTSLRDAISSVAGQRVTDETEQNPDETQSSNPRVTDKTYVYRKAHGLHIADLITNLRYSLWVEVPMVSVMEREAHSALMKYLHLLSVYHPAGPHVIKFLQLLHGWLEEHPPPVTSGQWVEALTSLEGPEAYIPSDTTWNGCRGTESHLRGYPCSLWMTFHMLTVKAHLETDVASRDDANRLGLEILLTIRGYIEHFFGCSECSRNFVYYSRDWLTQTSEDWPTSRAVVDLWRRHNLVNGRLHLQPATEDPNNPKIQFPAIQDCRECRASIPEPFSVFVSSSSDWNNDNVLQFLIDYYGSPKSQSCAERGKVVFRSKWSACSKTCGEGVSLRMTNNNEECRTRVETRVCLERPCSLVFPDWSRSAWHRTHCSSVGHTYRMSSPMILQFNNCTSKISVKRKVCGVCPPKVFGGEPVCCRPSVSRTTLLDFQCSPMIDEVVQNEEEGIWLNHKNDNSVIQVDAQLAVEVVELCECSEANCKLS